MLLFALPFYAELVVVLISVFVSVVLYFKNAFGYFKNKGIPYLEPKIPNGNLNSSISFGLSLGYGSYRFYKEFKKRNYKFGGIYAGPKPVFLPLDLAIIKSILSKDFEYFSDRGLYYCEKNCLSAHLFTVEGSKWRKLRVKFTPTFTSGRMKMMFPTVIQCSQNMLQAVKNSTADFIDIRDICSCFTTDVIGSVAFGLECNSFKDKNVPFRVFGNKLVTGTPFLHIKLMLAITVPKICKLINMSVTNSDVTHFFTSAIEETIKYRITNNTRRNDFLQILIDMMDNNSEEKGLSLTEIVNQSVLFFLAGFETSSTLMSFCFYELAKNQHVQKRLREEIQDVYTKQKGELTYETLVDLKYLSQVIDETLRLYPPLPSLDRQCVKDYQIPDTDIVLEKGTQIIISGVGLHHDADYFPNPEEFDPDRFSDENKSSILPFAYLPFGDGPRNCIGLRFGLMQAKLGIAVLIREFQITVHHNMKPFELLEDSFFTTSKNPILLAFKKC